MKNFITVPLILMSAYLMAQTSVNKMIPAKSGQKIEIKFDYPNLIKISTWDRNEVSIQGTVDINYGENDDAFELLTSEAGNTIYIENQIRGLKNLPQRIMIVDGGKKTVFKSKAEFNKYRNEHAGSYDVMSWGANIEIELEIKVPKNMATSVTSVYGVVEVKDFSGPLQVDARYGAVDAAINERAVGELSAETNYGQIYSNLEANFGNAGITERDFYTYVTAKLGTGPQYNFESKYGNVYLRKSN